jgi:hypothetical protein
MDLMSAAQLLGSFGEFVGAIAVVSTLVYLSVQIRQHTKQVASTYTQAMWERTDNRMMLTASNSDFAALIAKAQQDPEASLTGGEALQVHCWIASWFGDIEDVYRQHALGAVEDYALENRVRNFAPLLQMAQAKPSMEFFRAVMDEDFMAWLDGRLESLQPVRSPFG